MRIFFIGAVMFSKACLQKLILMKADVVGVCTLKESQFNSDHVDLSDICNKSSIPVSYTHDINAENTIDYIKSFKPDVIFCFGWSKLLKSEILGIAPKGVIGFHPTALPENRGRHPLIWALVLGLSTTGTTFFIMDKGADSGDIISQRLIKINDNDDAGILYNKMTDMALNQLEEIVPALEAGEIIKIKQDDNKSTIWRKRDKKDGLIDWRMSAKTINNLVRGLTRPYQGACFNYKQQEVTVWKAEIVYGEAINIEPGKLLDVSKSELLVKTGVDAIRILEMEPKIKPQKGDYI